MTNPRDNTTPIASSTADRLQPGLARIWLKNEDTLNQRLEAIRRSYDRLSGQNVDQAGMDQAGTDQAGLDQVVIEGRDAAHKLAGVLGTFGLARGTDLAREAEMLLDRAETLNTASAARLGSLLAELESMLAAKSRELKQT